MYIRSLTRSAAILATTLCLLCLSPLILAQEDPPEVEEDDSIIEGQRCLSSRPIRKTEVLDDQNILFYMRGRTIYHNILPRRCNGLAREGRFSYRVTSSNLCQLDSIRILYGTAGGMQEGRSCRLGYFHEVTEEDIEFILDREPRPTPAKPLPPAEPEDMTKETGES